MIKAKIDVIIKNLYFKLSVNNITFSILEEFFLEKIKNSLKAYVSFFYFLIKETTSV